MPDTRDFPGSSQASGKHRRYTGAGQPLRKRTGPMGMTETGDSDT